MFGVSSQAHDDVLHFLLISVISRSLKECLVLFKYIFIIISMIKCVMAD